ncbi:MAG: Xaa-Pro aminopeptidase [Spirochaetes bacterium]|nr:Xaa-Pro aminopeptidase [Spirochaetota bacterium]
MTDASILTARRATLRARLAALGVDRGTVAFPGNGESPMNYRDNAYPFRQDSSFLYFFGLSRPDLAAAIELESGHSAVYGDEGDLDDIIWTGPLPSLASAAEAAGIGTVKPRAAFAPDLGKAGTAHWLPPYRADTLHELAAALGMAPDAVNSSASLPLVKAIVGMREIKDDAEVAELEKAVGITVAMHKAALAAAKPGMTEAAVAAIVTREAISGGGGLSFPVIATTRGAILHNHDHSRVLAEGGLFLLDAGAETVSGYAGDLTTTFPIGRRFDSRQREIYDIVLSAGEAGCAAAKPGRPFLEAHLAAARAIAVGLASLGIMRGDPDDAVAAGAHALFFPHGLGHQLGLDVHDMENLGERHVGYDGAGRSEQFGLSALRLGKALKPGMVHTVEPGIYFIPELIARWKSERKFETYIDYAAVDRYAGVGGVRNEVNRLVTAVGGRTLGPAFDKSAAAIEAARG